MRDAQLKIPTKSRRITMSSICKLPINMIAKMPRTPISHKSIFT